MNFFDSLWEATGIAAVMESLGKKLGIKNKEYHADEIKPKQYNYRPQTLNEYVGQINAKKLVEINIRKIQTMKPVHFVITGNMGAGKSLLAGIISNELSMPMSTFVGGSFNMNNLMDFLIANQDSEQAKILFIDEAHSITRPIAEFLLPILSDFILPVGGLKLRRFCAVFATNMPEILIKKYSPLINRCDCVINLTNYSPEDIKSILKNYNDNLYFKNIEENIYDAISVNSRYNPRTSIALFEDFLICENLKDVFTAHNIIKDSLTINDVTVLKHLAELQGKSVSYETLSIVTQMSKEGFLTQVEPFLIQEGYISRLKSGRCITNKGLKLLEELNEA